MYVYSMSFFQLSFLFLMFWKYVNFKFGDSMEQRNFGKQKYELYLSPWIMVTDCDQDANLGHLELSVF